MDKSKWEYKKLGDICTKLTDGSHNPPKGVDDSDYRMISSQNIFNDRIELSDYRCLSKEDFEVENKRTTLKKGDLLLTIVGAIGRCYVLNGSEGNLTLQRSVAALTPNDNVISRYLMYYFIGNNAKLIEEAHGVAQKGIYLKQLRNFIVPIPAISDQQRIVAELDCLNEMIALKQEQLKEFDKLAQSIFYDMFGDPITNEKGWIEEIMGNVCSFSQGVQVDLEKQTLNPKDGFERFIRISDFTTTDCELRYVKDVDRKYHIDIDDIAIVRYGASAGFVCWGLKGILANNLFKLNHDKAILNTRFLVQQLSTNYYRSFIKAEAFGAAMPALSFKSLKHFKLILPPLALQQQFAEKIQAIEAQKELVKQSIAETQHLLDSRMDYYFD